MGTKGFEETSHVKTVELSHGGLRIGELICKERVVLPFIPFLIMLLSEVGSNK